MRDYNQHVRLLSSDPLVGLRLQSLFGPGSRHCFGIIARNIKGAHFAVGCDC